jgi:large subunit ribosomal protein L10
MPSQKNVDQLKQIKDKLDTASCMILVNYSGISVADQQTLRNNLSENDGSFNVTKNTLITLALSKRSPEVLDELKDTLEGPTAVIYSQDVVAASKALSDFTKNHPTFSIKAGLTLSPDQDRVLTQAEIQTLSKLPSKDQLYAQLLSQLNAPAQSLARVIKAPLQNLVYVLQNHIERG